MWKVYPRVGGATQMTVVGAGAAGGLSPRGRGNRVGRRYRYDTLGSIPAWAGQPPFRQCYCSASITLPILTSVILYQVDTVSIYDLLRRLPQRTDALATDRRRVSVRHYYGTLAQLRVPARQHLSITGQT